MKALLVDGSEVRLDAHAPIRRPARGEAVIRHLKAAISSIDLAISRGLLAFAACPATSSSGSSNRPSGGGKVDKLVGKRVVGSIISSAASATCARAA